MAVERALEIVRGEHSMRDREISEWWLNDICKALQPQFQVRGYTGLRVSSDRNLKFFWLQKMRIEVVMDRVGAVKIAMSAGKNADRPKQKGVF